LPRFDLSQPLRATERRKVAKLMDVMGRAAKVPTLIDTLFSSYSAGCARMVVFPGGGETGKLPSTSLPISPRQGDHASNAKRITTMAAANTSAPIQKGTPTSR
jgi:hypothetical protein